MRTDSGTLELTGLAPKNRPLAGRIATVARGASRALRELLSSARSVLTPEHVLWAIMAIALVTYLIVLIAQPTAAGRGGR